MWIEKITRNGDIIWDLSENDGKVTNKSGSIEWTWNGFGDEQIQHVRAEQNHVWDVDYNRHMAFNAEIGRKEKTAALQIRSV